MKLTDDEHTRAAVRNQSGKREGESQKAKTQLPACRTLGTLTSRAGAETFGSSTASHPKSEIRHPKSKVYSQPKRKIDAAEVKRHLGGPGRRIRPVDVSVLYVYRPLVSIHVGIKNIAGLIIVLIPLKL